LSDQYPTQKPRQSVQDPSQQPQQYGQQPAWGPPYQQPQWGPPQQLPSRKSWIRRHKILTTFLSVGALFFIIIVASIATAVSADFHAGESGQLSGELVADGAALPPWDGGGGWQVS